MHLHDHSAVVVLNLATGDCVANDIYILCIIAMFWYDIPVFPESRKTLQLDTIRRSTETCQEKSLLANCSVTTK